MKTKEEVMGLLKCSNITRVARDLGMSRVHLTNFANGKRPNVSYDLVKKLSDYFNEERALN